MSANMLSSSGFFCIDPRMWAAVAALGMNEAAVYLVLACGTGRDNRNTSWSAEAAHRYSGIAWSRAKSAIENLVLKRFIRRSKGYTKARPRYELMPFEGSKFEINENFIWVPNTIVTGTANRESSPLSRIRAAGEIWTLRLFIDLYAAQNLREDGGIHPSILQEQYERREVGERGSYKIWAFRWKLQKCTLIGPLEAHKHRQKEQGTRHPVLDSVRLLSTMGLLQYVPHLMESDSKQTEPIHPFGIGRNGEDPMDTEIGAAADAAGRAMCAVWAVERAEGDGFEWFCPVPRTLPQVQLVGVPRLRYRPHTKRTAAWYAHLQETHKVMLDHYAKIACNENSDLLRVRQA